MKRFILTGLTVVSIVFHSNATSPEACKQFMKLLDACSIQDNCSLAETVTYNTLKSKGIPADVSSEVAKTCKTVCEHPASYVRIRGILLDKCLGGQ